MHISRLTNVLWLESFRWACVRCRFAQPEYLLCNIRSLLRTLASNKELPAVTLPSNRRTFYSGTDLISNCEMNETESSDRWQHFAKSLGLALFALWSWLAYLLQHKYNFIYMASFLQKLPTSLLVLRQVMSFPHCIPIFSIAFPFKAAIRHLRNKLIVKRDQFCTAEREVENGAVLVKAVVSYAEKKLRYCSIIREE